VEKIAPAAVIIRTLDLGGDKFVSSLQFAHDLNPFMGWRAIRFCLERQDVFKSQLRAILRASAHGSVKIMYPMISVMLLLN
jgi:phosphotransferase system enzyme I (PtsI)